MSTGVLITFEGGEGAGKTTQIGRLAERLTGIGREPAIFREPGATPLGERVRAILLDAGSGPVSARAELLLYLAARAELVDRELEPALSAGRVVICDRYVDASTAYQGGGRELGVDLVTELNTFATRSRWPDRTFLLDLDPREGLARVRGRGGLDRLEREAIAFHDRVRETYLSLATEPRVVVLDATRSADEIAARVWESTRDLIGAGPD